MRLLLFFLSVCLFSIWAQNVQDSTTRSGKLPRRSFGKPDRARNRFGKLPEERKQHLGKILGENLDERKTRLDRVMSRRRHNMTKEERVTLQERLAKLIPVETERPSDDTPVDLQEVNMKEGISSYMYNGDIDLTDDQLTELEEIALIKDYGGDSTARKKRQASTIYKRWTGNTLNFYFDSSVSARKQASVSAAHKYIQARTCVNFVQSSTAANRVKVFNGPGCFSNVGMSGGEQTLSLGNGCEVIGTAAHEFMHALGIWHTQMRSDRGNYVTIDTTYVPQDVRGNFDMLENSQNYIYTPYEYGSVMHYGANSFTNPSNKLSIVPKNMQYVYTMGNSQISFYDIVAINKHYSCDAACTSANSAKCKNGGLPNPRNCAICNCPQGYEGALCDQRPAGCGETLTATTAWQTKQYSFGNTTDNVNTRDVFTYCNHWIQAPSGYNVQIQVTSMFNPQCQYGCPFNGIEIKGLPDQKVTNPRLCCPELAKNTTFISYLNPTPIISYNRYYYTTFTIQYRAVPSSSVGPAPTTVAPPPTTQAPAPPPKTNCHSALSSKDCVNNKNAGFCTSTQYDFRTIKYNCAVECGLCGKAANPCVDNYSDCAGVKSSGQCGSLDPMVAEYYCPKTCGFCSRPN